MTGVRHWLALARGKESMDQMLNYPLLKKWVFLAPIIHHVGYIIPLFLSYKLLS